MKIVIIGPAHPLRGGLAAFNERLARAFKAEGDEVTIWSFSLQYPSILFPGKTQYTKTPPPADLDIRTEINSISFINWIKVGKAIKKLRPDLVVVAYWMPFMSPSLGRIARIIKKNGHTKVIALVHNLVPHEKRMGDMLLTDYFVKSVDAFVALSRSVVTDIEKFTKEKPKAYTPHPIYDYGTPVEKAQAKYSLGLEGSVNYALFFGFIREYKGLDLLLNAFADERIRAMKLKLIVAGEYYSDPEPYRALIKKLNLENTVIGYNEYIDDKKVPEFFGAADIIVQPYKTATQSGVTQIAYHFNKPMIVTNAGGLGEIVPHGKVGYVVEPSAKAIADALVDFYSRNKEAEFSENAKTEKKRFGWDVLTHVIRELRSTI
jgi:D-inositol-3-phosphate glycosyltransferase